MTLRVRGRQRGKFAVGLIVGLLAGLVVAVGVALYVSKVPVPFVNKVPPRTPEQDAAEAEKNKNWDPNAGLTNKLPIRPPASGPATPVTLPPPAGVKLPAPEAGNKPARDPAAILAGKPLPGEAGAGEAQSKSTKPGQEPYVYFVQAGAYVKEDEAEQQRARLAMLGYAAKVTEREQAGRTMYRVRLGPFESKDEAEFTQGRLQAQGTETAMVRAMR